MTKEQIQKRIKRFQTILNNHKKRPFLSHDGIIIEIIIHELKQIIK